MVVASSESPPNDEESRQIDIRRALRTLDNTLPDYIQGARLAPET
jgi:hypothetical protein